MQGETFGAAADDRPALLGQGAFVLVQTQDEHPDLWAVAQERDDAGQRPQAPGPVEDDDVVRRGCRLAERWALHLGQALCDQVGHLPDSPTDRLLLGAQQRRDDLVLDAAVRQPAGPAPTVLAVGAGDEHDAHVAWAVQDRSLADQPARNGLSDFELPGHTDDTVLPQRHHDRDIVDHPRLGQLVEVLTFLSVTWTTLGRSASPSRKER